MKSISTINPAMTEIWNNRSLKHASFIDLKVGVTLDPHYASIRF